VKSSEGDTFFTHQHAYLVISVSQRVRSQLRWGEKFHALRS